MTWILGLLGGGKLYALGAAIVAVLLGALRLRRSGITAERGRQAQDAARRGEKGRQGEAEAAEKMRDGASPDDIVSGNDKRWRK